MARREYRYVKSSNIQGVAYDYDTRDMHVQFVSGTEYRYEGVDPEDYDGLVSAASPGRYLHDNIKDQYSATRV
jgi:hypothetical protein